MRFRRIRVFLRVGSPRRARGQVSDRIWECVECIRRRDRYCIFVTLSACNHARKSVYFSIKRTLITRGFNGEFHSDCPANQFYQRGRQHYIAESISRTARRFRDSASAIFVVFYIAAQIAFFHRLFMKDQNDRNFDTPLPRRILYPRRTPTPAPLVLN